MKKYIVGFIIGISALVIFASAQQVPFYFSTTPNSYNTAFPAYQLNGNFGYLDAQLGNVIGGTRPVGLATNLSGGYVIPALTYIAASGLAVNGGSYLVSTSGVPAAGAVQITLPASAPNATASFTDVYGTFNTSPLVIYSATDPINGVAGPVTLTWTTRWLKGVCQYTNIAAFGWLCR